MSSRMLLRKGLSNNNMSRSLSVMNKNFERIKKWNTTISSKANSTEARGYTTQLSSLIQYYNKKNTESIKEINWKNWEERIETKGLVEKVRMNYESLMKEQYDSESICNNVVSTSSKELEDLNKELKYHGHLWMCYIKEQKDFLFDLQELGSLNDYNIHEKCDLFYGSEHQIEELVETHNYIPGSKDDINYRAYLASQFAWGKKVVSFYRHPADDFKCLIATKNILGR